MVYSVAPNAAPGWNPAWKVPSDVPNSGWQNNPQALNHPQYPAYSTDGLGIEYYSLDPTLIGDPNFQEDMLDQVDAVLPNADAIYWDVSD